ncbi:putative bifunctional diguanylate cyclase/phosphodiesterase [Legionella sp. CNM-1927-20]|uniref:putative bifunctional diguanylate cyclase/phosphodiesterase n=1 Tax=Legionella sp. CNM-1927-20 TaxID=3422221 RepID=UPI00403A7E10
MTKFFYNLFISERLRFDVVNYAYAKSLVGFALSSLLIGPPICLYYYFFIQPEMAYLIITEIVFIFCTIVLMRVTSSVIISREIIILSLIFLFFWISLKIDFLDSPSTYWLVLPPFLCVLLGGFRTGFLWLLIITILLFRLWYLELSDQEFLYLNPYHNATYVFISILGLIYICFFIIYVSESGRIEGLKLKYRAYHDALTGLYNRYTFADKLELMISKGAPKLLIIKISVDNFDTISESLSSLMGDLILKKITNRLIKYLPSDACLARLGEDIFGVIAEVPTIHLPILLKELARPYALDKERLQMRFSMGVTHYPDDATTIGPILRYSKLALIQAKKLGGNRISYFSKKMAELDEYRLTIQSKLPYALAKNQFLLNFQPKFLTSEPRKLVGMEVLLRWTHPSLGQISPGFFIPVAEQLGLITEISDWVLDMSLKQYQLWKRKGLLKDDITLAVNFSVPQLIRPDSLRLIQDIIKTNDFDPSCLEIEITESIFINDKEKGYVKEVLNQLRNFGVLVALDDFGTGFSSLSYLTQIPLDILKIDKSFLNNFSQNKIIFRTIISLAHSLNLKVVAEGVEREEELKFLSSLQCDYIQGFYLGKPVSADKMENLLLTQRINDANAKS